MTSASKTKTQLMILREPVTTPDGVMLPDLYEIIGGEIPAELRAFMEPFMGARPPHVKTLNATQFARDLAKHAQRSTETPAPPKFVTRAELEQRYGWSAEDWTRAECHGFPTPAGHRLQRGTHARVTFYSSRAVERWLTELRALAVTVR